MADAVSGAPLEALSAEVKATLQLLIDADLRTGGMITAETLEAVATQGYVYLNESLIKLNTLTPLQKKAVEIAKRYESLPMPDKIGIIARTFGCATGKIESSPCSGKWRGTSDLSIRFDNGASLFIGNTMTPQARTAKARNQLINATFLRYNPEIVAMAKETALAALKAREVQDNEIAAQKGLKPYTLLNVEFLDRPDDRYDGYIGWYYVTLAVDGKIRAHLETGLNYDIAQGKVSEVPSHTSYYTAGALDEAKVDYVFNNVGFSSTATLYSLSIGGDALERAKKALAERESRQTEAPAFSIAPRRRPQRHKPRRVGPER